MPSRRFKLLSVPLSAFSLIEVTLALGIFAFAIIPILGILPVGLNMAQHAYRQNDMTSVLSSATSAIRGLRWDENNRLVPGGWLERPLPLNSVIYVTSGSEIVPSAAEADFRLEIETSGDDAWPGVVHAKIAISWPADNAAPSDSQKEETVTIIRIPY